MRFWTAHMRRGTQPALLREGFSWWALLFGPLWLSAHHAWIPAMLVLVAGVLILALAPGAKSSVLLLGLAAWLGLSGQDLGRRSIRELGFSLLEAFASRHETDAQAKILDRHPNLAGYFLPSGAM
jgi:hypothetical protein